MTFSPPCEQKCSAEFNIAEFKDVSNREKRRPADPNLPDDTADPDNDGDNNTVEWQNGTDPCDPDTDDDGEADSTDTTPFIPNVPPLIQPPSIHAYAGVEQVFVRYTITDTYQVVGLFRDEDDDMDELYTLHGIQISPTLETVFTDTLVTNRHEYCYFVLAADTEGRLSAPSAPSCAVPNTDPLPPHGSVLINGGAQNTPILDVDLTLWASDTVDPEVHDFGPDYSPPADSASGVTQMMISNLPDLSDGVWELYDTSKP